MACSVYPGDARWTLVAIQAVKRVARRDLTQAMMSPVASGRSPSRRTFHASGLGLTSHRLVGFLFGCPNVLHGRHTDRAGMSLASGRGPTSMEADARPCRLSAARLFQAQGVRVTSGVGGSTYRPSSSALTRNRSTPRRSSMSSRSPSVA